MLNNSFDLRFCDHLLYSLESSLCRSSSPTARRCRYWRRCLQRCLRWKQRRWCSASLPSSVLKARIWLFQIQYFASEYGLLWSRWWLAAFLTSASCYWSPLWFLLQVLGLRWLCLLQLTPPGYYCRCQVGGCNFMAFGLYLTPFLAHPVIIRSGSGHRGGFALRFSGRA